MSLDTNKIERRTYDLVELRVTPASEDDPPKITGYAAVFDELSLPIGDMFQEKLAPGAFRKALRGKPDVRALFNHDANYVLGRTTSKTLTLNQDDTGLAVEINPPDTQWARDLMVSMQRGDVNQMSFAFRVGKDEWKYSDEPNKMQIRTILEISELLDVSAVTYPAYPQTSVQARSALADVGLSIDDLEAALMRLKTGESQQSADLDQVRSAIAALEAVLPRADPEPTEETNIWRPAILRRRLELMALAR